MNEPFVLRDLLKIDTQGIRDRTLINRPEDVGIHFKIQDTGLWSLTTDEVKQINDPLLCWRSGWLKTCLSVT
jgi:hypothetical protein